MQLVKRALSMPGRMAVAVTVSLTATAGFFLPVGPLAYAKPGKGTGGKAVVEEVKAEPTTLGIALQSEGGSGPTITVPDRTGVKASVTLSGANASTAGGTVSYAVYSDSGCTNEVAWGGPRLIRRSTESALVHLRPGTYYWQASYSGDAQDAPSTSACGAAVEIVEGSDPPACSHVTGEATLATEEGRLVVKNDLSTDLGAQQKLGVSWSKGHRLRLTKLLGVACVAGKTASHFHGVGEAKLDGKPGYLVRFSIRVSADGEEALRMHVANAKRERVVDLTGSPAAGSESIT